VQAVKNPECKKYIHYSENFQGSSVFLRASASCSKILNDKKYFKAVKNTKGQLCFSGQAYVAQKS